MKIGHRFLPGILGFYESPSECQLKKNHCLKVTDDEYSVKLLPKRKQRKRASVAEGRQLNSETKSLRKSTNYLPFVRLVKT